MEPIVYNAVTIGIGASESAQSAVIDFVTTDGQNVRVAFAGEMLPAVIGHFQRFLETHPEVSDWKARPRQ